MSCEEDFFKQLRSGGFRLTPQREMVLSAMHGMDGLTTAEQILDAVQTVSSSVDISTVYRTLDLLQHFHLAASVESGDGQRRYELLHSHKPHVHLVCRICGQVVGADMECFQSFLDYAEEHHGFRIGLEQLSISGVCRDCSNTGDGRQAPCCSTGKGT
jgi:Fur family transcriptional regulator, ferric uptake regulator